MKNDYVFLETYKNFKIYSDVLDKKFPILVRGLSNNFFGLFEDAYTATYTAFENISDARRAIDNKISKQ